MTFKEMEIVERIIGYKFDEKNLLQQAFVRKSYGVEHDCAHNEVLELIGDRALDFAVMQLLVKEHCSMTMGWQCRYQKIWHSMQRNNELNVLHSNKTEGELTEIKKTLVQRKNLARRMDELGFIKFITMNQSDYDNRVYENASVKEDLFEAILGAVAIDCDWDSKVLTRVVDQMLQPDLSEEDNNYINELQKWSQKKHCGLPMYEVKEYSTAYWYISGYIYDAQRNFHMGATPRYIAYLHIKDIPETILGFGNTQSETRQDAARYALIVLEERDLLFNMRDEVDEPSRELAINQLETLSRRGYFELPKYQFEETYDKDGNPLWQCIVSIPETRAEFSATASIKKDAKKDAAYKLLMYLLED